MGRLHTADLARRSRGARRASETILPRYLVSGNDLVDTLARFCGNCSELDDPTRIHDVPYRPSPGLWKTISGTMQAGERRSMNRTPSAMSSGRIISDASTLSLMKSL